MGVSLSNEPAARQRGMARRHNSSAGSLETAAAPGKPPSPELERDVSRIHGAVQSCALSLSHFSTRTGLSPGLMVAPSFDLDWLERELAEDPDQRQERLIGRNAGEAAVRKLDVDGIDRGLVERRVDGDPAPVDVDLVPEVVSETAQVVDIHETDGHPRRYTDSAAHGGGQDTVLGAVAREVPRHLVRRWRTRS